MLVTLRLQSRIQRKMISKQKYRNPNYFVSKNELFISELRLEVEISNYFENKAERKVERENQIKVLFC